MTNKQLHAVGASVLMLAMLTACGGSGGSVNSTPAPTPAPAPAPTPSPADSFRTPEYNRSAGLGLANAATAYAAGWTGRGIVAAVIDSGVNPTSPEFSNRISPASQDVSGSRGVGDDGGHGTAVSGVLLAAKNDASIHGMAFDATLLSLRTDTPGSCNGNGDCSHSDNAIARALDIAVAQGAKVANLSLGGTSANATLRAAIGRATSAGMVIVMSAGNDGGSNPSDLALIATDSVARGQVIVAGSHGTGRAISGFSNRAGSTAQVFLTALGEDVQSFDETGQAFLFTGTSFSAPLVSGAVALLAQAFPNLTGAQIAQLLLDSADDAGAAGTDATFGRGTLNIGRAFQPRGQTALAGSAVPLTAGVDQATLSPAMGDAGAQTGMGAIVLDDLGRAYAVDLARAVRNARPRSSLAGALAHPVRGASLAAGPVSLSVSVAQAGGSAAGAIATRLDPRTSFGFGFNRSLDSLAGQLAGRADPAFMVARSPADALGFDRQGQRSATLRHALEPVAVTLTAEAGEGLLFRDLPGARDLYLRSPYTLLGVGLDRRFGTLRLSGGLSRLDEGRTLLGARFGPLFGVNGGTTWFADSRADWRLGGGWSLAAAGRMGWSGVADLRTSAFSIDLAKGGFTLRLAQPLRVDSGGFDLRLPVGYDYATGAVTLADQRLNLSPDGRELDLEASYSRLLLGGRLDANLFWRREPGHYAAAPDDVGAAMRWRLGF